MFKRLSKTGYKKNSKDRNNPYNIIPSNRISMDQVPHPVFGISDTGDQRIMMPGEEHQFSGSSVLELPVKQQGGRIAKKINPQDIQQAHSDTRGADVINPNVHVTDGMRLQDLILNSKQEIRERMHNNINPYSFENPVQRAWKGIVQNKSEKPVKDDGSIEIDRNRQAQFDKYLGYPYDKNVLPDSEYKPTNAKDPNSKYVKAPAIERDFPINVFTYADRFGTNKDKSLNGLKQIAKRVNSTDRDYQDQFGQYKVDFGEDDKGLYMSYYDNWDLNPFSKGYSNDQTDGPVTKLGRKVLGEKDDLSQGIGKPFEVYGRVHYDKNTGKRISTEPEKPLDPELINFFMSKKQQGGAISDKLKIQDSRTQSSWGEPLSKPRTGEYDRNVIKNIALAAQRQGNDPYTAIAVGMQESGLGTYTTENAQSNWGQVRHDKWDKDPALQEQIKKNPDLNPEAVAMNYVLNKSLAKKTGNEAVDIQDYNGYLLKPNNDIGAKKMYGIDLTKYPKGYDLKKDPRYGNAVIDLRDNVVKKNPELVDYVNNLTKPNDKLKRVSFVPDKNGYIAQLDGKPYGNQTFPDFASAKQFMTFNMDKFQQGGNVLPPVTVTGHKDPQTAQFFDGLKANDFPAYQALTEMGQQRGFMKVDVEPDTGRAFYSGLNNTGTLYQRGQKAPGGDEVTRNIRGHNGISEKDAIENTLVHQYLSEYSHHEQKNTGSFLGQQFKHLTENLLYGEDAYKKPGTIENEAHSVIQPRLENEYIDRRTKISTFKRGGFKQLQKAQEGLQIRGQMDTPYGQVLPPEEVKRRQNSSIDIPITGSTGKINNSDFNRNSYPTTTTFSTKGQDLNYIPQFTNSILQAVATRVNNNRDQAYQQNNLTNPLNVIPKIGNTNPYENYGVQQFQQGGQVQDDEESLQDFQDEDFLFSNDEEPAKQEQESPVVDEQAPEAPPQEEETPTIALDTSSFDDEEQQQGQEVFDKYDPGSYGAMPAEEGSKGNEGEAYNYLTQEKGIQPHIAAGIVGNLLAESGLNTGATGDSGLAKGIAQWHPDRQAGLMQFSRSAGKNPYDLKTQLDFVLHEAGQRGDLERIANTRTPSEAAYMFAKHYERPAKINPERMKYAEGVFNKYNKKS